MYAHLPQLVRQTPACHCSCWQSCQHFPRNIPQKVLLLLSLYKLQRRRCPGPLLKILPHSYTLAALMRLPMLSRCRDCVVLLLPLQQLLLLLVVVAAARAPHLLQRLHRLLHAAWYIRLDNECLKQSLKILLSSVIIDIMHDYQLPQCCCNHCVPTVCAALIKTLLLYLVQVLLVQIATTYW
jgi:hypothetical protein